MPGAQVAQAQVQVLLARVAQVQVLLARVLPAQQVLLASQAQVQQVLLPLVVWRRLPLQPLQLPLALHWLLVLPCRKQTLPPAQTDSR